MINKEPMKHFNLAPSTVEGGRWGSFNRNSELADLIYKVCLPHVNKGRWSYINPMSNIGIFEDEVGNYLYLNTDNKGEQTFIHKMHVGLNDDKVSGIIKFIKHIKKEFNLARSAKEN